MKAPDFFIIGAPKCGTTALNDYLNGHPNIFMGTKETHYFASDMPKSPIRPATTLDGYLEHFKAAPEDSKAVGEASVWYMYSGVALENIRKFNEKAKIIAMLRNPVDMVYSLHSQLLYNRDENIEDFKKAWRLQEKRKRGLEIPRGCAAPSMLQYAMVGRYGEQLERAFGLFPKEQVKVILFDDFASSTSTVYEDVLSFLGVPSDGRENFPRINENKVNKVEFVSDILRRPPSALSSGAKKIKDALGIKSLGIWRMAEWLIKLNTRRGKRKRMPDELRKELVAEFEKDIDKLSLLLGRNLDAWKK